jgi:hypothetical protein
MSDEQLARDRADVKTCLLESAAIILKYALAGGSIALIAFSGVFIGFILLKNEPKWLEIVGFLAVLSSLLILLISLVVAMVKIARMGTEQA